MDPLVQVQCFLLDMDGTFYLGDRLIDGALKFIDVLRHQGREYLFLTNNSSKDSHVYAEKITRMGLPTLPDGIMTTGEATAMHIQSKKADARVYIVGTPELENEFRLRCLAFTDENPDFAVLGFDTTLTYVKLWKLCDLVRVGTPYIATHPDFNCPTESGFLPDIGAMIAFVKASTGREPDLVVGKPNRLLAEKAAERFRYALPGYGFGCNGGKPHADPKLLLFTRDWSASAYQNAYLHSMHAICPS